MSATIETKAAILAEVLYLNIEQNYFDDFAETFEAELHMAAMLDEGFISYSEDVEENIDKAWQFLLLSLQAEDKDYSQLSELGKIDDND